MKCILIKLEDSEYYDDKYNFPSFIVEYEENIEEKLKELEKVCKSYDDFNEVEDFIKNNFKNIEYLQYTIEI